MPPLPSRRRLLQFGASAALAGAAAYAYAWRVEPHWVEVVRRELPVAGLPPDLAGATLVQISDLHAGPEVDDDHLRRALGLVNDLAPDFLALTGDYMTCQEGEQVGRALRVLSHLRPARLGTFAILGNHDYGMPAVCDTAADRLSAGMRDLGIAVLRNEAREVRGLTVAGLDDYWGPNFAPRPVLRRLAPDRPALVLCHNPDVADLVVWGDYRGWILSGHTHGGQCRPPFLPPPLLPVKNRRYTAGAFDLPGGRRLYINRGLGHLRRVRFNVRPEITAFTLVRDEAD